MRAVIIIGTLAFASLLSPVSLRAGTEVQNGAGAAEQRFALAYLHMNEALTLALSTPVVPLTTAESEAVRKIRDALPLEYKTADQIIFEKGGTSSRFAIGGGTPRVAVTGSSVGDRIYINLDLIYDEKGAPMSVGNALAILTHELGHHQRILDHTFLDLVGMKVQMTFLSENQIIPNDTQSYDADFWKVPKLELVAIHEPSHGCSLKTGCLSTQLSVLNGPDAVDLTPAIFPNLKCGDPAGTPPLSNRFSNLHWLNFEIVYLGSGKPRMRLPISGNLNMKCQSEGSIHEETLRDVKIELTLEDIAPAADAHLWRIIPDSTTVDLRAFSWNR